MSHFPTSLRNGVTVGLDIQCFSTQLELDILYAHVLVNKSIM